MDNVVKIAVISDLHCKYSGGKTLSEVNTYLTSDILPKPINRNPVESLKALIKQRNLSADLLLCPGDITDKIDIQGLVTGWDFLQQLSSSFNAKNLIATIGNHDVDSRAIHGPDKGAFDSLSRLSDVYPTPSEALNQAFWANSYCILDEKDYIVLNINSCFNHTDSEKAKTSLIKAATIEAIKKELSALELKNKVKVALFHHHPMHHSNIDYKDGDFIDKSDELLKLLDGNFFDICIHGHKHDPRLEYKNSIAVFSAGAFSSTMNILDLKADNTFHLISVEKNQRRGIIESWIYSPKDGWKQKADTYFPCLTGFGYRVDIISLAKKIADWFNVQAKDIIFFNDVRKEFPDVAFLIPFDQEMLGQTLLRYHSLKLNPQLPNQPEIISKLYQ